MISSLLSTWPRQPKKQRQQIEGPWLQRDLAPSGGQHPPFAVQPERPERHGLICVPVRGHKGRRLSDGAKAALGIHYRPTGAAPLMARRRAERSMAV